MSANGRETEGSGIKVGIGASVGKGVVVGSAVGGGLVGVAEDGFVGEGIKSVSVGITSTVAVSVGCGVGSKVGSEVAVSNRELIVGVAWEVGRGFSR